MTRVAEQPGWVLHARPYRESSALLEVWTRDHGRVGLVARGARGARSRWKGILQPFRPLLLAWSQRGELGTLTGAEQVAAPPSLRSESLYCGLYVNELLMRLTQRADPHPELFGRYRDVVLGLASGEPPQQLLRLFERDLLADIGFALPLDRDAAGRPLLPGTGYRWAPEAGFVVAETVGDSGHEVVDGAALVALREGRVAADQQADLRRLMRRVIRYHLGDRPLNTAALFY